MNKLAKPCCSLSIRQVEKQSLLKIHFIICCYLIFVNIEQATQKRRIKYASSYLNIGHGLLGNPRDATACHQGKQGEDQVARLSQVVEGLAANVYKCVELPSHLVTPVDHVHHVWGQDERDSVPLDRAKLLSIAKKLSKVDVE